MHQTLPKKDAIAYVAGRRDGALLAHDLQAKYTHPATIDWVDDIIAVLDDVLSVWNGADLTKYTSDQSRDELEGVLSARLHQGLTGLPAEVLTDKDFWRFCAAYLYDFVVWRQPTQSTTALHPYFGVASDSLGTECVPHRMFNRAQIARAGSDPADDADLYALAKFGAADVWKSHILRTRNSYAPAVVHALLTDVVAGKLPTDPVRLLAKNLKRVRSNVLFEVLDSDQARHLVDREEQRVAESLASSLDSASLDG